MNKKSNKSETDIQKIAEKYIECNDPNVFAELYARIKYGLRLYIFGIVKNNDYVDEVETLVLEKVWKNIHMYDPYKAKFSTWLYKIAFYDSVQYITRKTGRPKNLLSEDIQNIYNSTLAGNDYSTSNSFIFQDDFDMIKIDGEFIKTSKSDILKNLYDASLNCINDLPNVYKLILEEKLINSKTIIQIAEDNDIPVTTVKNRLFHGRKMLKDAVLKKHKNLYNLYTSFDID